MAKRNFEERFESQKVTRDLWNDERRTYEERQIKVPVIPNLNQRILDAVEVDPRRLDMKRWHGASQCGTTHCIAGWAVTVAGRAGKLLERQLGDTEEAAILLFKASLHGEVPDFFCENPEAKSALYKRAAEEAEVVASAELGAGR